MFNCVLLIDKDIVQKDIIRLENSLVYEPQNKWLVETDYIYSIMNILLIIKNKSVINIIFSVTTYVKDRDYNIWLKNERTTNEYTSIVEINSILKATTYRINYEDACYYECTNGPYRALLSPYIKEYGIAPHLLYINYDDFYMNNKTIYLKNGVCEHGKYILKKEELEWFESYVGKERYHKIDEIKLEVRNVYRSL